MTVIGTAGPIVICGLYSYLKENLVSSEVGENRDEFSFFPSPNSFMDTQVENTGFENSMMITPVTFFALAARKLVASCSPFGQLHSNLTASS